MLSPASRDRIAASPGWRRHRIEVMDLPEGRVVVKGQRPPRSAARFWLMRLLARWTHNPLLRPVPAPGGAAGQATEARRLRELAAAGVHVPALWHEGPDHLVMAYVAGTPLPASLVGDEEAALAAFRSALDALADVHARGQYLSQAFARNMVQTSTGFVYLDFEDDPLEVMTLIDAQARDWLALLLSTVWMTNAPRAHLAQHWRAVAARLPVPVRERIDDAARRLAWLRHLPSRRDPWGRDVVSVQALAAFLAEEQRFHSASL